MNERRMPWTSQDVDLVGILTDFLVAIHERDERATQTDGPTYQDIYETAMTRLRAVLVGRQ